MANLKKFLRLDRDYFYNNKSEINRINTKVLRYACLVYLFVLTVYTVLTVVVSTSKLLSIMYFSFDAIHIVLTILVLTAEKNENSNAINLYRVIFEITLLSFFVLEAVFAFPNQTSIYLPFPIILLVMAFPYRVKHALALIFTYVVSFMALVLMYKAAPVALDDIYIAVATLLSSTVGYFITATMRYETNEAIGQLRYLSMTDVMTGLTNKQTFESLCKAFVEDPENERGYALLFFDVDKFKQINDKHGHLVGDAVLKSIGTVMRESFYEKDFLCRFGGDEFVVLMIDVYNKTIVAERVRAFTEKVRALSHSLKTEELSCSVGIAMRSQTPESYDELISRADAALYIAKELGRRQIYFSDQYTKDSERASVSEKQKSAEKNRLVNAQYSRRRRQRR